MITFYNKNETIFTHNGLGILDEYIINPVVTEELNGIFSLEFDYPTHAPHAAELLQEWLTTIPSVSASQFLWTRTIITYTDSTTSTSYSVGMMGATGAAAPTITQVREQYYLSTSNTSQAGGSWSDTVPTWVNGRFYWTRVMATYSNSTTTTSTPVLAVGLNSSLVRTKMSRVGSKLATITTLKTTQCNIPRNQPISKITIHHAAGVISGANLQGWGRNPSCGASWHYGVGNDGVIGQLIDERNRPWTSSSGTNDHKAITLEVGNSKAAPTWEVGEKAWNAMLNLLVDICQRNPGIKQKNGQPGLYFDGTPNASLAIHKFFQTQIAPALVSKPD